MSNSLWPHRLWHTRLLCPSSSPRVCSNSRPLSWWCHPTISSSAAPCSSRLQSFPASGPFLMIQVFASGGQSIGASASASVLPMNIQDWFPLGWTGLMSLPSRGLWRVFPSDTVGKCPFSSVQPSLWSSSILTALYYKPGPVGGAWDTVRILTIERGKEDLEATVVSCKGSVGMGYWWCPTGKEHPVHTWGEGRFLERRISAY